MMIFPPYLIIFIITITSILFLRSLAFRFGLLDAPNDRKTHYGSVPLVGGIAMFIGIVCGLLISNILILDENYKFLILSSFILIIVGVVDDYHNISHKIRFFFQIISALIIILFGEVLLKDLGSLFTNDNIYLGPFALVFSIFAILGVLNSLNFSDGIDGLSASLSIVTFLSVAFLAYQANNGLALNFVLCFFVSISAFLIFNIGLGKKSKFKIFMGDAGSTFLGLGIAWTLISFSQGDQLIFSPVTALWIYSIPLVDTSSIMIRRISNRKSPFSPDREHLHHFFILYGWTDRQALSVIIVMSIAMASIGIGMEVNDFPERLMFLLFMMISFIYYFALRRAWKLINVK
jgi:UDP-GlcNAc:undecaprenyl-phosphate/decaprenyl-phosphate GlcNAc-1-phosphate transferase